MILNEELHRYAKQIQLDQIGIDGQRQLSKARVLCIGAGGLAAPLLLYLAAAGVGTLAIVDHDSIELSNLHRQILFTTQEIDKEKVISAKEKLLSLNPNLKIDTYHEEFNPQNAIQLISDYDIVADCSDNFSTRYLINDYCFAEKKPFVSASVHRFSGQCTFFPADRGPCYRCLFEEGVVANHSLIDCNNSGVIGVLPGLLGVIQASEILKWVLNIGDLLTQQLLMIDLMTMQFRKISYHQDPNCLVCAGQKSPVLSKNYSAISSAELTELLQSKQQFLLLDIRTIAENAQYNLGGKNIPLAELTERLNELDPTLLTIVYCQSGQRSRIAAEILSKANFLSVKYLLGGCNSICRLQI